MSAGFVAFATTCALATTIIAFSIAACVGLSILIPVLIVTVPLAAFFWACTVGSLALADWVYRNLYVDSGVQATVSKASDEIVQNYSEIEVNAMNEYEKYKGRAIEGGQQAKERGSQMYDDASRKGEELYDRASQGAGQAKQNAIDAGNRVGDEANYYADAGKAKASELQQDTKQFGKDAKYHANGVQQKGKELGDQTKESSKGVANAAKNDFRN